MSYDLGEEVRYENIRKELIYDCRREPLVGIEDDLGEEVRYENLRKELIYDYRREPSALTTYNDKFNWWKSAYPKKKKDAIIKELDGNWSKIYKKLNAIFKEEVWDEYKKEWFKHH